MTAIAILLALLLSFSADPDEGACISVSGHGTASLGHPVIIPAEQEPLIGGGALPFPIAAGAFRGEMSSVVHTAEMDEEGVQHLRLTHYFVTDDGDAFWTEDEATCTPLPDSPGACRVVTRMRIVRGVGGFVGAVGLIVNEGTITMTDPTFASSPYGVLEFNLAGEICGLGV